MKPKAIVTIPPYATFINEVVKHPAVCGLRLNTVMPINESYSEVVKRLNDVTAKYGKEFWMDLKCRQLRVKSFGVPPFTEIELSHNIKVDTPVTAYFKNGEESVKVLKAYGNKLIMEDGPRRVVGPGEAVNIPDKSLEIEGFFTDTDLGYIKAMIDNNCHNYMLSFVEGKKDIEALLKLDPKANIVAKIESQKGLDYVKHEYKGEARLMAARGDLYIEVGQPHKVIDAVEDIVRKDKTAIAASRIFPSLSESLEPSCADIGDADNLMRMGYRQLMFGDEICQRRESIISGLNLLYEMAGRYALGVSK